MMLTEQTAVPAAALPVQALKDHLRLGSGFADAGLQVARFPASPTVRLPSGTALADVLYAAGNLIAR